MNQKPSAATSGDEQSNHNGQSLRDDDKDSTRITSHPEEHDEALTLYQDAEYQHPHTLSFLSNYTPEEEARMMADLGRAVAEACKVGTEAIPPAQSFKSSVEGKSRVEGDDESAGWGIYVLDL